MYSKVLVPIDESIKRDKECIQQAREITEPSGVIHCLHIKLQSVEDSIPDDEEQPNPIGEIEEMTDSYQEKFIYESVAGSPSEDIAAYARQENIDAIVMNTYKHERSGVEKLLTKSVTDETIKRTDIPVLVLSDRQL